MTNQCKSQIQMLRIYFSFNLVNRRYRYKIISDELTELNFFTNATTAIPTYPLKMPIYITLNFLDALLAFFN